MSIAVLKSFPPIGAEYQEIFPEKGAFELDF